MVTWSPKADAQVIAYFFATTQGNHDVVNLRFTSSIQKTPPVYDVVHSINLRDQDDEQRAALRNAFERGLAVYVGAVIPQAVQVELKLPESTRVKPEKTNPWSLALSLSGYGSHSSARSQISGSSTAAVSRETGSSEFYTSIFASYSEMRQPPLMVEGQSISLDTQSHSIGSHVFAAWHLNPSWSIGVQGQASHQDKSDQYLATLRSHAAIGYDWFASDDPRGNSLSVMYLLGYQADWYNHENVLRQNQDFFPTHGLIAQGEIRKDKIGYNLELGVMAETLHSTRRYIASASPSLAIEVGDHVDVIVGLGFTKQAVPGPAQVDSKDFNELSRSSYADPINLNGSLSLRFHWDKSDTSRNNRLQLLLARDGTAPL